MCNIMHFEIIWNQIACQFAELLQADESSIKTDAELGQEEGL